MQPSCYLVGHKREGGCAPSEQRAELLVRYRSERSGRDAFMSVSPRVVFSVITRLRSAIKCSRTGPDVGQECSSKKPGVSEGSHVICVRQAAIFPHVLSSSQ